MSELKRFWHYCFWFKDSHLYVLEFLEALFVLRSNSLLLLLRIFKVALLFICQGSLYGGCPPTEKEGFEPSRRY